MMSHDFKINSSPYTEKKLISKALQELFLLKI